VSVSTSLTSLAPQALRLQGSAAIEVEGPSASYRVRLDAPNLRTDLRNLLTRRRDNVRIVPALRDVSFTVTRGSVTRVFLRQGPRPRHSSLTPTQWRRSLSAPG
jgi:hypothetical protein